MIYFDNAASGPMYPEVWDLVSKAQIENFSNPSSKHILGQELSEKIEEFRSSFLKALGGSRQDEFIFTGSATESNNTVIRGLELKAGDVVLYSRGEHASVTGPVEFLKETLGVLLREFQIETSGSIDLAHFESLLDEKVKLVILTHVNNQSGVINDVLKLSQLVKGKTKAHVHIDAVQSFGKIPLKISAHMDSLSVTSHKMGGPKGVAGLYLKSPVKIKPLLIGGGQEKGLRSGTESYPLILGFHQAMMISLKNRQKNLEKVSSLNQTLTQSLQNINGLQFPFESSKSPYVISFILPGASSDIVLRHLEREGVYVSTTSACSSRIAGFNQSLQSLNIPEKYHKNFLRVSLGVQNTPEEVNGFLVKFRKVWDSLCNHI